MSTYRFWETGYYQWVGDLQMEGDLTLGIVQARWPTAVGVRREEYHAEVEGEREDTVVEWAIDFPEYKRVLVAAKLDGPAQVRQGADGAEGATTRPSPRG